MGRLGIATHRLEFVIFPVVFRLVFGPELSVVQVGYASRGQTQVGHDELLSLTQTQANCGQRVTPHPSSKPAGPGASQNLTEFGFTIRDGKLVLKTPKCRDIEGDRANMFLRLES